MHDLLFNRLCHWKVEYKLLNAEKILCTKFILKGSETKKILKAKRRNLHPEIKKNKKEITCFNSVYLK